MKPLHRSSLLVAMVGLWPDLALSQDLRPLNETSSTSTERTYSLVRCAAFYTATMEWGGKQLSEDTYDSFKDAVDSLLMFATLARAQSSPDEISHVGEIVMMDARTIADLYLDNFRKSYAGTGNAWENNRVWESDIETCEPIARAAIDAVNEIEGETQ